MLHTASAIRSAVNVSIAKTTRLPNTGAVWRIIESPSCVKNTTKLAELNALNENHPSSTSKHLSDIVEQLLSFYRPGRQHQVSLNQLERLRQLVVHLCRHPEVRKELFQSTGLVSSLIKLKETGPQEIQQRSNMALSLLGCPPPYKGRGLRILSIDGGGTRGLIPIILLQHLERVSGLKVHDMFDYVAGTSTGSILASLIFLEKVPMERVEMMYRELSSKIFKMNNFLGLGQLFLNQSFYDSSLLEKQVRNVKNAEKRMYETMSDLECPKMSFISTLANQVVIEPFLFANYRTHPDRESHYKSTCDTQIWQAIMASTAAPGYFEEVKLGQYILQDGGLLTNNPAAIALHEARRIWGNAVPIQCLISLGTGRFMEYDPIKESNEQKNTNTSLREKLTKVVASATDTEAVHTVLQDLLPPSSYYRFNPTLSEFIALDNCTPSKLQSITDDTHRYAELNENLLIKASQSLKEEKTLKQKLQLYFGW